MRVFREFRVRVGSTFETDGVRFVVPRTWGMDRPDPVKGEWRCRGCGVSRMSDYIPRRLRWAEVQRQITAARCLFCVELDRNPDFVREGEARVAELIDQQENIIEALVELLGCVRPVGLSVSSLREAGLLVVGDGVVLTQHEPEVARQLGVLLGTEVYEVASCIEQHVIGGYLKIPLPRVTGPGRPYSGWRCYSEAAVLGFSLHGGEEDYLPGTIERWRMLLGQFATIIEGRAATTSVG